MSNILSYSSLTTITMTLKSRFGGSSKFKLVDGELIEVGNNRKQTKPKYYSTVVPKPNFEFETSTLLEGQIEQTANENKEEITTGTLYKLNKSKIKRKCFAFSRLEKSKKFLAFYSISFPIGLSDDNCYKVFNIWLTRCRRDGGLISYLWVAERQKNETIHFHLLTNDHMQIRTVNGFMAIALHTFKKKGVEALQNIDPLKYNGVDVKRVKGSRKALIGYLVKYISKNEIKFFRLPWHCSRDVSRLFTSENFDDPEDQALLDKHLPNESDKYNIYEDPHYTVKGFKFSPPEILFSNLDSVNEIIYHRNNH
ncbi:MAG: hypothetical protein LWW85_05320 [Marinilabiliales bacterium]|nr:hypothetical protein [Marinilabiliales bacterium]